MTTTTESLIYTFEVTRTINVEVATEIPVDHGYGVDDKIAEALAEVKAQHPDAVVLLKGGHFT